MALQQVTKCGIPLNKLIDGICTECSKSSSSAMSCQIRREDIISERLYEFCRKNNCLRPIGLGIFVYDEKRFLYYIKKHPSEIRKRKWLQEIAIKEKIDF